MGTVLFIAKCYKDSTCSTVILASLCLQSKKRQSQGKELHKRVCSVCVFFPSLDKGWLHLPLAEFNAGCNLGYSTSCLWPQMSSLPFSCNGISTLPSLIGLGSMYRLLFAFSLSPISVTKVFPRKIKNHLTAPSTMFRLTDLTGVFPISIISRVSLLSLGSTSHCITSIDIYRNYN